MKRVHVSRGKLNVEDKQETVLIEGNVKLHYISVSSTWELISVAMRYSQGDGVSTSLSRLVLYPRVILSTLVFFCVTLHYPRHGHVLYGTIIIKISVCTPTIPAELKYPLPSKTISMITWFEAHLNTFFPTLTSYCYAYPPGKQQTTLRAFKRGAKAQRFFKLIARNAWDVACEKHHRRRVNQTARDSSMFNRPTSLSQYVERSFSLFLCA